MGELLAKVETFHPAIAHDLRILHLHATGRRSAAERLARDPGRPVIPVDWVAPTALVVRGLATAAAGSSHRRSEAYAQLRRGTGQIVATGSINGGPVDWALGQLAASLGDIEAAAEHWRRLEQLSAAAGIDYWRRRAATQLTGDADVRFPASVGNRADAG
jgi:hypothetical protein